MRLPFLQVSQEEIARARTLAGYLGVSFAHALGMTVALKAAALEAAPEGDVSGSITDSNPAEWISVQCGWPLERADTLALAMARCGFVMAGPCGGHAVAGMEPYARALDTSGKRSEAGRKGAEARKSMGGYGKPMAGPSQTHGQVMAPDAKTQTQTQTQKEALPPPTSSADHAPPAPERAQDAEEEQQESNGAPLEDGSYPLTREGFWAWSRAERAKRLPRAHSERQPRGFADWWRKACAEAGERHRIFDAFVDFLGTSDFHARGCPMQLFMSDSVWRQRLSGQSPPPQVRL